MKLSTAERHRGPIDYEQRQQEKKLRSRLWKASQENAVQKGISGNLRGRPKKSLDFSDQLIKESRAYVTISENGQKKRLSKQEVVIKTLFKLAMNGNIRAVRTCLDFYHEALEGLVCPRHNS
jgi:hypothetical protein